MVIVCFEGSFEQYVLVRSIQSIVLLVDASVFLLQLLPFVWCRHPLRLDQRGGRDGGSLVLSFLYSRGRFFPNFGWFVAVADCCQLFFLMFGGGANHVGSFGLPLPMSQSRLGSR